MAISSIEKGLRRRGLLAIISSPSGAGKSTITRRLLEDKEMDLLLSVSVTTRQRRSSEIDGVHYHFISKEEFKHLCDRGALIEWAEVHGNFYGTLRETVDNALTAGHDILFDIDWQGSEQLQEKMPTDAVSIFIFPPTMHELQMRLKQRAEDTPEIIETRLHNAHFEIQKWIQYDYIVLNEDLHRSYVAVRSIICAERLRRERQTDLSKFVNRLLKELPQF